MTPIPASHADHDPLAVAAHAAGDATGSELDDALALVAGCADCAALHHDLRAIALAMPALPAPVRTRDFRLTPEQAASLRPPAWRRLLAPLAGPRFAFAGPLGTGLATLGIAGFLLAGTVGMPLAGTAAAPQDGTAGAGTNGAYESVSGTQEKAFDAGSMAPMLAPVELERVGAGEPSGEPVPGEPGEPVPAPGGSGEVGIAQAAPAESTPAGSVPVVPLLSGLLVAAGLVLAGLRVAGRRLAR